MTPVRTLGKSMLWTLYTWSELVDQYTTIWIIFYFLLIFNDVIKDRFLILPWIHHVFVFSFILCDRIKDRFISLPWNYFFFLSSCTYSCLYLADITTTTPVLTHSPQDSSTLIVDIVFGWVGLTWSACYCSNSFIGFWDNKWVDDMSYTHE